MLARHFDKAVAAAALMAVPNMATAQIAKQCLTPREAQSLISFALPDIITSVSSKCTPTLGSEGYLTRSGKDLSDRYRAAAGPSWPMAKTALKKYVETDPSLLDSMPDDALKGFFGAGVATAIVKDIRPEQCGDIDRIVKLLAPLPAENMSQLVGIVLEIGARPKAQAAAQKAKVPFSICPAAGGSGKPVTTK